MALAKWFLLTVFASPPPINMATRATATLTLTRRRHFLIDHRTFYSSIARQKRNGGIGGRRSIRQVFPSTSANQTRPFSAVASPQQPESQEPMESPPNCINGEEESADVQKLYENAVARLNALQSNAQTIALNQGEKRRQSVEQNVQQTHDFLQMINISLDDIDRLNVVHITGTKGKGSTACFLESILRSFGYKTGFFSSPHLVHATERIRINGQPISKRCFAENFFPVYRTICERKREDQPMPAYFKFLTLLAFRIFVAEQVDVAIVEVGIGGEHDCTNVIRHPIVCAISTLDFDHTKLLGNSLAEIAWNKAGIAKPGSVLLSVEQPPEAMSVIRERSKERKCPLLVVPPLSAYRWPKNPDGSQPAIRLGIAGTQQHSNASLALQIARQWLWRRHQQRIESSPNGGATVTELLQLDGESGGSAPAFSIPPLVAQALQKCRWPGRSQVLRRGNVVYHLDGAHTPQSTKFSAEWFSQSSNAVAASTKNIRRVLLFHCTGDRNSAQLLANFKICNFDLALFSPTLIEAPEKPMALGRDSTNLNLDPTVDCKRCERDREIWREMDPKHQAEVYSCIAHALARISALSDNNPEGQELHVLVTGSLHLVGGVLALLDPNLDISSSSSSSPSK